MRRILIWDVPTRLFHWTLVASFIGVWLTSESDRWLSVHVFLGYLILGLVGFRIIWGITGTHYARFASFWFSPKAALVYARQVLARQAPRHLGHNPAGSLAIYLLLLLALVACTSGILTLGGEEAQGAAAGWLDIDQGRLFKKLHEALANVMMLLVLVHVAGVVVESVLHRENLARSMVTGTKLAGAESPAAPPRWPIAALMLVLIAGFGAWWFFYALHATIDARLGRTVGGQTTPHVAFVGRKLADNAQWREECGGCHLAFHPSLLPRRSWQRIMAEQSQHFGADLAFDATTSAAVLAFMSDNSADRHATEAALKIDRSIKPDTAPLRVTETPYWIDKHRNIASAIWQSPEVKSKANCAACHLDAEAGTFLDAAMHIPSRGAGR
jgi:cytochrome b